MGSYNHPLFVVGAHAIADVPAFRIVKDGGADGKVAVAIDGSVPLVGITTALGLFSGKFGDLNRLGIAPVEYGAAVTRWQELTADAVGRAVPAGPGDYIIGYAAEDGILGTIGSAMLAPQQKGAVKSTTLAIGHADLDEADGAQSFDFAAALPANSIVLGYDIRVTEGFTDGAAGVFTLDVGISAGDLDQLVDGAALANIADLGNAPGVRPTGRYGAVMLAATVLATVNVDTATAGQVEIEVFYA